MKLICNSCKFEFKDGGVVGMKCCKCRDGIAKLQYHDVVEAFYDFFFEEENYGKE